MEKKQVFSIWYFVLAAVAILLLQEFFARGHVEIDKPDLKEHLVSLKGTLSKLHAMELPMIATIAHEVRARLERVRGRLAVR